jgi:predicted ATPase
MALSPALSIAGAEFHGVTPQMYIQDEGWDCIHAEHQEELLGLISEIAKRFGRFIMIAHLPWMIQAVGREVRVVAENGVSRLEAG